MIELRDRRRGAQLGIWPSHRINSISHCSSTYSAYIGFNENSFHTFTLSVFLLLSFFPPAQRSPPLSPFTVLEIKAPTRSEISAINIRWKNWNPWLPEFAESVGVAVLVFPTTALFLFLSKLCESSSFCNCESLAFN